MPKYGRSRALRPRRRRPKRKTRTRAFRRYKRRALAGRLPITGFPAYKVARLKYVTQFSINPPTAGVTVHEFSANGMFDPDITGTGHQPKGFDEWMAIYDHYTVIGSRIRVTPTVSDGTVSEAGCFWGIYLGDTTGVISGQDSNSIMESKNGQVWGNTGTFSAFGSKTHRSLKKNFSAKKFFRKMQVVGSQGYRGTSGTNPTENAVFIVWTGPIAGNDAAVQDFVAEIEYIAVFTERRVMSQS